MIRLDYAGVDGPDSQHIRVEASDSRTGVRLMVILPRDARPAAQQLDALMDDLPAWVDLALQRADGGRP